MLPATSTDTSPSPSPGPALPTLDKSKTSAPVLAPKINRPVRMPKAVDAWHRLQRIAHIDVEPIEGTSIDETMYTVSVYLHHNQNRIPTNNLRSSDSTSQVTHSSSRTTGLELDATPDLQVLRTFAELDTLRHNVWTAVRHYHPIYCELCDGLVVQMVTKLSQPKLLTATIHRSRATRAKKMRKFLMRILAEMQEKKSQCVAVCKGQSELPMLLHSFLFGDESEPTASA